MDDRKHQPNASFDTDALNTLVRAELSAVETYDRAMAKLKDQHVLADLRKIRDEHARSANLLRAKLTSTGAEPPESTGPWVAVAAAVAGTACAATALSALCQGEEHAVNEYEDALKNDRVNPDCEETIRAELLPGSRRHVDELNRLVGGMG